MRRQTNACRPSLGYSAAFMAAMSTSRLTRPTCPQDCLTRLWFPRKLRSWCSRSSRWSSASTPLTKWPRCSKIFNCRKICTQISSKMLTTKSGAPICRASKCWRMVTGLLMSKLLALCQRLWRKSLRSSKGSTIPNLITGSWCGSASSELLKWHQLTRSAKVTSW